MSSSSLPIQTSITGNRLPTVSSTRFDGLMTLLNAWLIGGLYLDGWAHNHGMTDATFFTPWHALFYAAFGTIASVLWFPIMRALFRGDSGLASLPSGYLPALVGVAVFALGGLGDTAWHLLFGVEQDIEALLSPTHLLLMVGMVLILLGPIRACDQRANLLHSGEALILLGSLGLLLALFCFFTQFAHPAVIPLAAAHLRPSTAQQLFYRQALGIASILLHTIAVVCLLLWLRWHQLPLLAVSLLLIVPSIFVSALADQYWTIPATMLAASLVDGGRWLMRGWVPMSQLRIVAVLTPVALQASYFGFLLYREGTWWSIHLVGGVIIMSGLLGLSLSYVLVPEARRDTLR